MSAVGTCEARSGRCVIWVGADWCVRDWLEVQLGRMVDVAARGV